jgi:putative PIN family toxin of toxin-antitoxin system
MDRNVVLDTNVIVSAHLKEEGLERFVLDLALAHKIQLFISPEVFAEYRSVLSRPKFRIKPDQVAASLALIEKAAIKVTPRQRLAAAKDPDDNIFLECASESQADYLVTGNKRHFPRNWGQTRIVNARELLEEIAPDLRVN